MTMIPILALLWLAGLYMRAPVLIAAPLADDIQAALNLDAASRGTLTTLPVLMLGLGALPAAWLIGRFGARNTLVGALLVTAIGCGARGVAPELLSLLAATSVMGLGIAAMQPAMPALVPRWCPGFIALGSAVYMNGMMLGEFVGAGLTLPLLLPAVGGDWRLALLLFAVPALLLAPLLLWPHLHGERPRMDHVRKLPDWREPRLWLFGLMLGTTAATFFGINAYMGNLLEHKGMGDELDTLLVVFNLAQIVASVLMMSTGHRVLRIPRLLFMTVTLHQVGLAGILLLTGNAFIAAAVLVGFISALQLIALVSVPPLTLDAEEAGKLAAGMFAVGYVLAFGIPLFAGMLADVFSSTDAVVWLFLVFNLVCMPLAWRTATGLE